MLTIRGMQTMCNCNHRGWAWLLHSYVLSTSGGWGLSATVAFKRLAVQQALTCSHTAGLWGSFSARLPTHYLTPPCMCLRGARWSFHNVNPAVVVGGHDQPLDLIASRKWGLAVRSTLICCYYCLLTQLSQLTLSLCILPHIGFVLLYCIICYCQLCNWRHSKHGLQFWL